MTGRQYGRHLASRSVLTNKSTRSHIAEQQQPLYHIGNTATADADRFHLNVEKNCHRQRTTSLTHPSAAFHLTANHSNKDNNRDIKNNLKLENVAWNVGNTLLQTEQQPHQLPAERHGNSSINQRLLLSKRYQKSTEIVKQGTSRCSTDSELREKSAVNRIEMGRREIKRSNTSGSTGRPHEGGSGKLNNTIIITMTIKPQFLISYKAIKSCWGKSEWR